MKYIYRCCKFDNCSSNLERNVDGK